MMLARAMSIRQPRVQDEDAVGFEKLDNAILELEREAKRLADIRTWTETIQNNSEKALKVVKKDGERPKRPSQLTSRSSDRSQSLL
jgi:hypothetical protein